MEEEAVDVERYETVIVGGGQAGLAAAYHLQRRGRSFVVLDASRRVGDSWRSRYDSLRLFTPSHYSGLPGWRMPAPKWTFATRDEMAGYLEAYAERFALPIRSGTAADGLFREEGGYLVTSGSLRIRTGNVVLATGTFHRAWTPEFAKQLDPAIAQLHSSRYRNPSQLRKGDVLIVGAGNSGADLAMELAGTHHVVLAGRDVGHVPPRIAEGRHRPLAPLLWFVGTHVITMRTPIGRAALPKLRTKGAPLIRVTPKQLAAAGVERTPRAAGVTDGHPRLEDGRVLDVANVIWCTGFRPDFGWIDFDVASDGSWPQADRGAVVGHPGLYYVGREFDHSFTSAFIGGVGREAEHVVRHIVARS
jgi:putative flavoprotein involved in K+ transport